MNKIKHFIAVLTILFATVAPTAVSATPLTQFGAKCTNHPILTFPSWYKGLECTKEKRPDGKDYEQPEITKLNDIWVIALNVVESLVSAAAYVAVGYIIWGGFKYMKSRGDPGQLVEAKNTITQAVIGLGVALASTAMVLFVQGIFNGSI